MIDYINLADDLALWIRDKVGQAKAKGVVYGLSGGIDSAVVAGLAKKAFPQTSLGLMMPCHSDPQDLEDASLVAQALDLQTEIVDLTQAYDSLLASFPLDGTHIAKTNIKPRLRMTSLYYYGQSLSYLVLGGTNKSEYFIGYFTKHGDSGVDMMPIGGLTKRQVYKLGAVLNIPDKIIEKAPSAGLYKGQTDEDDLGFSYAYLDEKIENRSWTDSDLDQRILAMHKNSKHKYDRPLIYKREDD